VRAADRGIIRRPDVLDDPGDDVRIRAIIAAIAPAVAAMALAMSSIDAHGELM